MDMDFSQLQITQLIPQRPPFVMVDKVLSCDLTDAVTELYVSEDNMLLPLKIDNQIRDYYVSSCKTPVKDMSNMKKK